MDSSPHIIHEHLAEHVRGTKNDFLEIGKLLYYLKENDQWREAVGEGIETWQSYLAQPEIGLSVSEANRLIAIYRIFVEEKGFDEDEVASVPVKNLHYMLPIADMVDQALFDDAKVLSQRDFRERVQDLKTDDGIRTYEYMVMRKCKETGSIRKVHGIESDSIKSSFGLDD